MKYTPILMPILFTASLVLGPHAVLAQPPQQGNTQTELVRYGDLDLTGPAGVAMLDRRIAQAIQRVCNTEGATDLTSMSAQRHCRREARAMVHSQRSLALAAANSGSIQLSSRR